MKEKYLRKVAPYTVDLEVDGKNIQFEIDTGCNLTLMNEASFRKTWENMEIPKLSPSKVKLEMYTGQEIQVMGQAWVSVSSQQLE